MDLEGKVLQGSAQTSCLKYAVLCVKGTSTNELWRCFFDDCFDIQRSFLLLQFIIQRSIYMGWEGISIRLITSILLIAVQILGKKDAYFTSSLNLYVSDQNYTTIFNQVGKNDNMIAILFTNKFCTDCYANEPQLVKIIDQIWRLYRIKIYRSQISANEGFQEDFGIKRFPIIHYILPYHLSYIPYQSYDIVSLQTVKRTLSRLQYILKKRQLTQKQSAIYINEQKLFFLDQNQIIQQYCLNPVYQNLPNLIFSSSQKLKVQLINDQIPQSDVANCIIYWKVNKKCFSPTTAQQVAYIFSVINYQQVIQFTQQTYKAYQQLSLNRYIFVAVLDSIFNRQKSEQHLNMLNNLLQRREFHSKITIFWMQTQINKQKLIHLGFKQTDHPPLFSLFDLSGAEKKILINQKKQPVFSEESIIGFIKNIIRFDQGQQLIKWNQQLLRQSLIKLKLSNQFKLISLKDHKFITAEYFVLSFPMIEYELLGDAHIFYRMILNYRYLIERINRFTENKIQEKYLTFDKYKYKNASKHGLFYVKQTECYQISEKVVFQQEEASKNILQHLDLPDLFWIHEDHLEQYLLDNSQNLKLNDFEYVFI